LNDFISSVQPAYNKLKTKYELAVRQTTLQTIEKEKAIEQVEGYILSRL
jgi:hypothetical protein